MLTHLQSSAFSLQPNAPVIFKFGTGILAEPGGCAIDVTQVRRFAKEISSLIKQGIPCILVSSAAIAAGVHAL